MEAAVLLRKKHITEIGGFQTRDIRSRTRETFASKRHLERLASERHLKQVLRHGDNQQACSMWCRASFKRRALHCGGSKHCYVHTPIHVIRLRAHMKSRTEGRLVSLSVHSTTGALVV